MNIRSNSYLQPFEILDFISKDAQRLCDAINLDQEETLPDVEMSEKIKFDGLTKDRFLSTYIEMQTKFREERRLFEKRNKVRLLCKKVDAVIGEDLALMRKTVTFTATFSQTKDSLPVPDIDNREDS